MLEQSKDSERKRAQGGRLERFSGENVPQRTPIARTSSDKTSHEIKIDHGRFQSFGQNDYNLVHNEIIDIKSCRTNIFTGTLGLIGAAAIAILTIWGSTESYSMDKVVAAGIICAGLATQCRHSLDYSQGKRYKQAKRLSGSTRRIPVERHCPQILWRLAQS